MEDKVRKMQQLKDKEKEELVSTLQNGNLVVVVNGFVTIAVSVVVVNGVIIIVVADIVVIGVVLCWCGC